MRLSLIAMTRLMRCRQAAWSARQVYAASVSWLNVAGSGDSLAARNVGTRLGKLDNGDYDAIILAVAGLKRLGLEERIRVALPPELSLPAVGRGAVGIECRLDDARTQALLAPLNHDDTAVRVKAERAMNTRLEGGCQVPIGSYAELTDGELWLRALVGAPDGSQMVRGERRGKPQDAEALGVSLAEELLNNGAREILAEVYNGEPPA